MSHPKPCVVCLERPINGLDMELCEKCHTSIFARKPFVPLVTWAANRARAFERKRNKCRVPCGVCSRCEREARVDEWLQVEKEKRQEERRKAKGTR